MAKFQDDERYQILIDVATQYIPEQSKPREHQYVFSYTISITNIGTLTAQLLSRHWLITDGNNEVQEVKGEGVVGEQPILEPGATFTYSSGAVLKTPVGHMQGAYHMLSEDGQMFEAPIDAFTLARPHALH